MAGDAAAKIDQTERSLQARLRQVFGGKRWIVAGDVAQGIAPGALALESLGADDVIAIASRVGVGALPDTLRFVMTDGSQLGEGASMVERMHDNNRELHDLPAWVIAEIDEWDPHHEANVVVSFTIDAGLVAERPTFGARTPEWAALEDKIVIRSLWHDAGIATAPDQVVDLADTDGLLRAHEELGSRWGTVWAVDNDQGWHGGGKGTHWVTSPGRVAAIADVLAEKHHQVRVQPFLEGVPCSIHGMVLGQATLVFRPCETMVLLDTERETFEYSRAATFWDPEQADRDSMRSMARAIGDGLRDRVSYRGVFTVDGVMTAQGFRPTEVNPRFGAALPPRLPTADGDTLPLFLMHLAAVTGQLDDLDADALEKLILNRLDANRAGSAFIFTTMAPPDGEPREIEIVGSWVNGQLTAVGERGHDGHPDTSDTIATATWGTDPDGGLIFVTFTNAMPVGPAVAPTLLALRTFLSEHWQLSLARLRMPFDE